jgi:hypothetical protein
VCVCVCVCVVGGGSLQQRFDERQAERQQRQSTVNGKSIIRVREQEGTHRSQDLETQGTQEGEGPRDRVARDSRARGVRAVKPSSGDLGGRPHLTKAWG